MNLLMGMVVCLCAVTAIRHICFASNVRKFLGLKWSLTSSSVVSFSKPLIANHGRIPNINLPVHILFLFFRYFQSGFS